MHVLLRWSDGAVVAKPGSVPCHHSEWLGGRDKNAPIPLLQRARDVLGERINLVHRLDRGASGCVLCAFADSEGTTQALHEALADGQKTYVALVRGEGILNGETLRDRGWFTVERAIKNENGEEKDATTEFRFLAGQPGDGRCSLVLARPKTGRWHQIRRHLNGEFGLKSCVPFVTLFK